MNSQTKSILSAILVIVALALGYFGVYPRWTAYQDAKTAKASAQQENDRLQAAQKQLTSFLTEYRKHASDAQLLNEALPLNQTAIYNVLNNLDNLSRDSQVSLSSLAVNEKPGTDQLGAKPNTIYPIDMAIVGAGDYVSFKNFLVKLESNLRIIDVNSVSIQQSDAGSGTFNIDFRTYYQK